MWWVRFGMEMDVHILLSQPVVSFLMPIVVITIVGLIVETLKMHHLNTLAVIIHFSESIMAILLVGILLIITIRGEEVRKLLFECRVEI